MTGNPNERLTAPGSARAVDVGETTGSSIIAHQSPPKTGGDEQPSGPRPFIESTLRPARQQVTRFPHWFLHFVTQLIIRFAGWLLAIGLLLASLIRHSITAALTARKFITWTCCRFWLWLSGSTPPPSSEERKAEIQEELRNGFWYPLFLLVIDRSYNVLSLARRINDNLKWAHNSPLGVSEIYQFLVVAIAILWNVILILFPSPPPFFYHPMARAIGSFLALYVISELFLFLLHWVFVAQEPLENHRRSLASLTLNLFELGLLFTIVFRLNACQPVAGQVDPFLDNIKSLIRLHRVLTVDNTVCNALAYYQLTFGFILISVIIAGVVSLIARKEKSQS